jgi:hypothetical protein
MRMDDDKRSGSDFRRKQVLSFIYKSNISRVSSIDETLSSINFSNFIEEEEEQREYILLEN